MGLSKGLGFILLVAKGEDPEVDGEGWKEVEMELSLKGHGSSKKG